MNQSPMSTDTVLDRVFRASKELADALAAYRRLQARLDEQPVNRQSTAVETRGEDVLGPAW
jgi:hypothetical protein